MSLDFVDSADGLVSTKGKIEKIDTRFELEDDNLKTFLVSLNAYLSSFKLVLFCRLFELSFINLF